MTEVPGITELQEWLARQDRTAIAELCAARHPRELAQWLATLDDEPSWAFLRLAPAGQAGEIFSHLPIARQAALAERFDDGEVAALLEHVPADDRTDLIQALAPEQQQRILTLMVRPKREAIERLTQYPEGTVGAVTNTEVMTLRVDETAGQAIEHLRRSAEAHEATYYNYILDEDRRLAGIVSLRTLIRAQPNTPLREIMDTEMLVLHADEPRTEAARKIQEYDLLALPVVNADQRFLGIVTVDDVMDVVEEETTEAFHRIASVGAIGASVRDASLYVLYRARVGWLLILVFINIFTGAGIAYYEDTLEAVIALAFFLPLLIDSGGNAGSQSATLMIRSMATGDVKMADWVRLLGKEIAVALAIGLTMAVAVWLVGHYIRNVPEVAIVVAITMVAIVLVGSLIGMSLPFLLTKCKLDPATASAPLVTSLADISGVLIYFAIATWYLRDQIAAAAGG